MRIKIAGTATYLISSSLHPAAAARVVGSTVPAHTALAVRVALDANADVGRAMACLAHGALRIARAARDAIASGARRARGAPGCAGTGHAPMRVRLAHLTLATRI